VVNKDTVVNEDTVANEDTVVKLLNEDTVVKLPNEVKPDNTVPSTNHHNHNQPDQLTNGLSQITNSGPVTNSMFCHQRACTVTQSNSTEPGVPPLSTRTVWSNIQSAWTTRPAKLKEPISTS